MVNDSEATVERHFVEAVSAHGGIAMKFVTPGRAGAPDRIVIFPYNRVLFVELKRPKGGRVRSHQTLWHGEALKLGVNVETLWTTEEVNSWVRRHA